MNISSLLRGSVLINFLTYSVGSVALRGVTALSALLMVRVIQPTEFGVLGLINTFTVLFPVLLNMGLRQGFGLEFFHHDRPTKIRLLNETIGTYLLIAIPLCTAAALMPGLINNYYPDSQITALMLYCAIFYAFVSFFSELFLQVLRYQMQAITLTSVQLVGAATTAITSIILVFYIHMGILGALLANTAGVLSIALIGAWFYFRTIAHSQRMYQQLNSFGTHSKQLLWLGLPFIPNILLSWLLTSGDRWALAWLADLEAVGIYSLSDTASQLFTLLVLTPLSASYVPDMLRKYTQGATRLAQLESHNVRTMLLALITAALGCTVATLGAFTVGPFLLPAHYCASLKYVWLILMGNVFHMGTYFATCFLIYKKRMWPILATNVLATTTNIALNIVLIPLFGIYGCVSATFMAQALFFCITLELHRRIMAQEGVYPYRSYRNKLYDLALEPLYSFIPAQKVSTDIMRHFTVLITSYNNINYYQKNIESVLSQTYKNFNIVYVDDCSSDGTGKTVEQLIQDRKLPESLFALTINSRRNKKLANLYNAIHTLPNNTYVVELDGDDALAHNNVLQTINDQLNLSDAHIGYANYKNVPEEFASKQQLPQFSHKTPRWVAARSAYRTYPWIYSGLRFYQAGLFKKIKNADLIIDGKFLSFCSDLATFYPMLELAGGHSCYIDKALLLRTIDSPINDFKIIDDQTQQSIRKKILETKPYKPVDRA